MRYSTLCLELMKIYKLIYASCFILLPTVGMTASPVGNVGTSKVDRGAFSIENRVGYSLETLGNSNHKRFRARQHVDYGWNDWYATRVVIEQNKLQNDNLEHASVTLENRFQLFEKKSHGWDGGVRLIYGHRDGDKTPHEIDFRLMAGVPFANTWEWRHNTVLEHDVGENSTPGLQLEFRNQITNKIDINNSDYVKSVRVGGEIFNDFGRLNSLSGYENQDHQIGPVAKINFHNGAYLQTGYRAGISRDSADHLFKMFIGKKF